MIDIPQLLEFNQYNLPAITAVIGGYLLFLWLAVLAWVLKDITTRTQNFLTIFFFLTFILIGNVPALVIYLLLRPEKTLEEGKTNDLFHASVFDQNVTSCHHCHTLVRSDFKFCPNCSVDLLKLCPDCNYQLNPLWKYCINCGLNLTKKPELGLFFRNIAKNISRTLSWIIARPSKIFNNTLGYFRKRRKARRSKSVGSISNNPIQSTLKKLNGKSILIKLTPLIRRLPHLGTNLPKILPRIEIVNDISPSIVRSKVLAEKRHTPKLTTQVVVSGFPVNDPNSIIPQKSRRGRPKGTHDYKPRAKRADAGQKRGKYSKQASVQEV